ncbi:MAG TPA: thrombospondin type 3 repeat-containing protein [Candidatus Acidoferrum sp.]|nr:thrombospondin type 3 repeat-containing protein [Candidatus Acidoferrum sp.]
MKTKIKLGALALLLSTLSAPLSTCFAGTTIDAVNKYAYGANIGWLNAYADGANGAVIGDYYCMGYLYAANVGWINLGSGSPANGIQYQNNSGTDFGINQDGLGNLRGYAYGANIGWINFENTGAPKVDLRTGILSGYVWSANCGWISLSNAVAYVQTDTLWPGQLAPNGLPVPWLLANFGTTNVDANADPDHDGMSNAQEYQAGTNPNDANSVLRITAQSFAPGGTTATLTWNSVPTRFYYILKNPDLKTSNWTDSGLGLIAPAPGTSTTDGFSDSSAPMRFYRVQAVLPLSP